MTARFLASWTQFHWSNGQSKSVDRKKPRFSAVFRGFHGTELVEPPFDPHSCSCAMVTPIVAAKKRAAKKAKRITTMERLERQFISQSQQLSALCNTLQDQIEAVEAVEREFRRDIANMGAYLDGAPPPTKRARSPSRAVASPDEDDDDDDADEDEKGGADHKYPAARTKVYFTDDQEEAIRVGMQLFKGSATLWADIKNHGSKLFAGKTSVHIKDKARNMNKKS